MWQSTRLPLVQPPIKRRPPGRPKKSRVKEPDEPTRHTKLRIVGVPKKCKAYGRLGYNKRSCKGEVGGNSSLLGAAKKPKRKFLFFFFFFFPPFLIYLVLFFFFFFSIFIIFLCCSFDYLVFSVCRGVRVVQVVDLPLLNQIRQVHHLPPMK